MGKKLPIGIEDFAQLRTEDFYYADKTGFIKELLQNWGQANLFTRPRRFGKSLNMSMLKRFFEYGDNSRLFQGLEISREKELCEAYMGRFPVIFVSLKGIQGSSYEMALKMAGQLISAEARRFQYLLESSSLQAHDKKLLDRLMLPDMDEPLLSYSLNVLSQLLEKHHRSKVILLIDEYDVPLAKAFAYGYYDQMTVLIRSLFEQALKTNESLQFAVLTGCMRISKESIFTGLNNLKVLSIADVRFAQYFGFTDSEVRAMMDEYGLQKHYGTVREWYDGYQFGNEQVYCPWDVINYCDILRADPDAQPQNYWANTSSNDAVRQFIAQSDNGMLKRELEQLAAGEQITKEICQELTYRDMYRTVDNLWSVLFTAGYLTQRGRPDGKYFHLAIPNLEIREIFTNQIMDFFKKTVQRDGEAVNAFCDALKNGDAAQAEKRLQAYLKQTVSIRDTFGKKEMKENFYHGILLGILSFKASWGIFSNRESGEGYSDILIETDEEDTGIVIEVKYPDDSGKSLEKGCLAALAQIEQKRYEEYLREEGMTVILKYGVACYRKQCRIMLAENTDAVRTRERNQAGKTVPSAQHCNAVE